MYAKLSQLGVALTLKNVFSAGNFPVKTERKIIAIAAEYIRASGRYHEF